MASAITYTGGTGLFDQLGAIFQAIEDTVTRIAAMKTRRNTIASKYTSAQYDRIANTLSQIDARIAEQVRLMQGYRADAQATLIKGVDAVIPLKPNKTVAAAIAALIDDMNAGTNTVEANSVSVGAVTAARADGSANTGTGTIVVSLLDELGRTFEYFPSGVLEVICTADAQLADSSGAERFLVRHGAALDGLDPDWPGGAGLGVSSSSIIPGVGEAGMVNRQVIKSGKMDTFSGNLPLNFAAVTGTPGTDIDSATPSFSTYAAAVTFKTTVASEIKQTLNDGGSTSSMGYMLPSRRYLLGYRARKSAAAATGTLRAAIKDATPSIIAGGTAKLDTTIAAILDSAFTLYTGTFVSPSVIPSVLTANLLMSTALGAAESVNVNDFILAPMHKLSAGGVHLSIVQGSAKAVVGDRWAVTVTNGWGSKVQKGFERCFGMRALGLQLPSATGGGETIADSVVA